MFKTFHLQRLHSGTHQDLSATDGEDHYLKRSTIISWRKTIEITQNLLTLHTWMMSCCKKTSLGWLSQKEPLINDIYEYEKKYLYHSFIIVADHNYGYSASKTAIRSD